MGTHESKDKPIDWVVLIGSIGFITFGVGAPYLLYKFGDLNFLSCGLFCWEPYVAIICFVVYFSIGKLIFDIRRDKNET